MRNNNSMSESLPRPRNLILAQLPDAEYETLAKSLVPVDLPLHMRLSEPNEPIEYVYFLNSGLISTDALTEKGDLVNGRGDTPNKHDALTGTQPDGTAFAAGEDRTCGNWTSSTKGAAMLGHIDRQGLRDDDASKSWNSSHPSRGPDGGCSQNDLKSTGGDGLFYCFAIN